MDNSVKMNYKSTYYIGGAFFAILMLWTIYNAYAPIYLTEFLSERFASEEETAYIVGVIMALDNFFALFMLPIFGTLSDKTKTKWGRRMPYILLGMFASAIAFPLIAVMYIINSLTGLILMMLLTLIIMNIYRNPAVALMPDITPKPLRSRANGIINLVGYIGAILAGVLVMVFGDANKMQTLIPFLIVSGFLLVTVIVMAINIHEPTIVKEMEEDLAKGEALSESIEAIDEFKPLSKHDRRNFIILMIAVVMWFAAFNAIETFMSTYAKYVFGDMKYSGQVTIILVFSSLLTFVFAGKIAEKIGRKTSVLIGLGMMVTALFICIFLEVFSIVFILSIAFCGIGWALINVNSYPMMVEMAHKNNVGKFTGYYYTASMFAQSLTPIAIGYLITINNNYRMLFPYATVLSLLAFGTFFLFKEKKDIKRDIKKGLEAFDID